MPERQSHNDVWAENEREIKREKLLLELMDKYDDDWNSILKEYNAQQVSKMTRLNMMAKGLALKKVRTQIAEV